MRRRFPFLERRQAIDDGDHVTACGEPADGASAHTHLGHAHVSGKEDERGILADGSRRAQFAERGLVLLTHDEEKGAADQ